MRRVADWVALVRYEPCARQPAQVEAEVPLRELGVHEPLLGRAEIVLAVVVAVLASREAQPVPTPHHAPVVVVQVRLPFGEQVALVGRKRKGVRHPQRHPLRRVRRRAHSCVHIWRGERAGVPIAVDERCVARARRASEARMHLGARGRWRVGVAQQVHPVGRAPVWCHHLTSQAKDRQLHRDHQPIPSRVAEPRLRLGHELPPEGRDELAKCLPTRRRRCLRMHDRHRRP